jgi:phospholipid/cholesterol/gamma-HCH transport system substrate-binding protein
MHRNVIETVMGGVVLLVAVFFLIFAYSAADLRQVEGYELVARFDQIDGLSPGADVRISGVKVGSVVSQTLDAQSYLAEVRMTIDPSVDLPEDTIAEVTSEGLLGGKFMSLSPGGSDVMLEPGGTIQFTQSSPGLEQLLGQVIFSLQDLGSDQGGGSGGDGSGSGSGGDSLGDALP